jgi:hypothetical protein
MSSDWRGGLAHGLDKFPSRGPGSTDLGYNMGLVVHQNSTLRISPSKTALHRLYCYLGRRLKTRDWPVSHKAINPTDASESTRKP